MVLKKEHTLSRRGRQIMDIIYERGTATAAEVMERLPDPPSYSATRTLLRLLVERGHLSYRQDGARYVYEPTASQRAVRKAAVKNLVSVFFGGSVEDAVAMLIDQRGVSPESLDRIAAMIDEAKREERQP